MNKCLKKTEIPEWMTKGNTTLIPKDPLKGTALNNYRPITCLPMMWKILTAQIREKIYNSLINHAIFPEEQKGWSKRTRSTKELLYIDQDILNESKTRRKNLAMAWINYRKAYDMVPQSWIYKIPNQVVQFIKRTMQTWTVELTAGGQNLAEVKIQRSIFQRDALSPLLFVIAMTPLNHILKKYSARFQLSKSHEKINHLTYMDNIELFAKNEKELETLIQTVRIYSQDIGIEFSVENAPC